MGFEFPTLVRKKRAITSTDQDNTHEGYRIIAGRIAMFLRHARLQTVNLRPRPLGRASPRFNPCGSLSLHREFDPSPSHQTNLGRSAINFCWGLHLSAILAGWLVCVLFQKQGPSQGLLPSVHQGDTLTT